MIFLDYVNKNFHYKGRINRKPYICFMILYLLLCFILPSFVLTYAMNMHTPFDLGMMELSYILSSFAKLFIFLLYGGFWLMFSIFIIFQTIRRLHDLNLTGGICLIYLLCFLPGTITWGILLLFQLLLFLPDGTAGPNQYGEDPKGRLPETSDSETKSDSGMSGLPEITENDDMPNNGKNE